MQRREERGPVSGQMVDDQALALRQIGRRTGRPKLRDVIGQVEREAPIVLAERLEAPQTTSPAVVRASRSDG